MPNLRNFTFHHGTVDKPLAVTSAHVAALVAVAQDPAVTCDVSGCIRPQNGSISAGDKYVLQQAFPSLIIIADTTEDTFTLYRLGSGPVDEGSRVELLATGVAVSGLDFEVSVHSITGRTSEISEAAIRERIAVVREDGRAYLAVEPPEENASWTDEVTVTAWPKYDPTNRKSITIVVRAAMVTEVNIVAEDVVMVGGVLDCHLAVSPSTNTKASVGRTVWSVSVGRMSGSTFIPPSEPAVALIVAEYYLFGSAPSFVAQKSVSVEVPTAVAAIGGLEPGDEERGAVTLRDTVTGTTVTLLDGQSAEVTPGRAYEASATDVDGYLVSVQPATFEAIAGRNLITAAYKALPHGVMVVYEDGDMVPIDEWDYSPTNAAGSKLIAAGYRDSQCSFMIAVSTNMEGSITTAELGGYLSTGEEAALDFAGEQKTKRLAAFDNANATIFSLALQYTLTVGGVERRGYVGAGGELMAVVNNKEKFNIIFGILGLQTVPWSAEGYWYCWTTSSQANSKQYYVLGGVWGGAETFDGRVPFIPSNNQRPYTAIFFKL